MKFYQPLLWSLGIFLLTPACVSQNSSHEEIIQELRPADIVYLGEVHNRPQDHQAQLEILQALYNNNSQIAIALEMFQRPFQEAIDRYLAGEITEAQLREQTEYDQRWGFSWSDYAPLLRFAKRHNLPVLALNTPTEITRKVAQQGLDSLTEEDFRYIPARSEIHMDNPEYRQHLQQVYNQHHGHGNSGSFENFFAAQVLWDETMADKIAQFYRENPNQQILVIAGQGHIAYGHGIPNRVTRRLEDMPVTQRSVIFLPSSSKQKDDSLADYLWFHFQN